MSDQAMFQAQVMDQLKQQQTRFPDNIDWESTQEKHEEQFWTWCIENGIHNEDYILDNIGDLFEDFADGLEDKDFIYYGDYDLPSDRKPLINYTWKASENRICDYCKAIKPNPWECKYCNNMD
jgi:hypothetical protein